MRLFVSIYQIWNLYLAMASRFFRTDFGLLLHHTSCAFLGCAQCLHLHPVSRHSITMLIGPVTQHLGSLLKYTNQNAYIILVLTFEVYFQWSCLSEIPHMEHWCVVIFVTFGN
eukprot:UN16737